MYPQLIQFQSYRGRGCCKLRIATIKDAVADLFNFINLGVDYNLGFVKHLNAKLKASRQIVEVTLDNEKKGRSIRKALAEKIKDWRGKKSFPDRMNGVTITPSLTLATRVRIAMLKTFASLLVKEFENTETLKFVYDIGSMQKLKSSFSIKIFLSHGMRARDVKNQFFKILGSFRLFYIFERTLSNR